ncbi:MAG: hypothetical protein ACRDTC_15165, partial [Pseudonocardiaceae bacterium]
PASLYPQITHNRSADPGSVLCRAPFGRRKMNKPLEVAMNVLTMVAQAELDMNNLCEWMLDAIISPPEMMVCGHRPPRKR